jgi:hypothetical protein
MLGRGIARCPTAGSLGSTGAPAVSVQSLDAMPSEQVTEDEARKQKGVLWGISGWSAAGPTAAEHAIVLVAVKNAALPRRSAVGFGHP